MTTFFSVTSFGKGALVALFCVNGAEFTWPGLNRGRMYDIECERRRVGGCDRGPRLCR